MAGAPYSGPAESPAVATRRVGRVVEVVIGSGSRANALATDDWRTLERVFRDLATDPEVGTAVVRGTGRTFSSGSNLHEWVSAEPSDVDNSFAWMESALTAIEECPVPVIAAVDGVAAGAGCQLALACDLQIITERARIGMPIARLGILVSPSFAARISVLAGPAVTRELLYTGRLMDGAEAVRVGLATRCVPAAGLDQACRELVDVILGHPAAAHRATKRSVGAVLRPIREAARAAAAGHAVEFEEFRAGVSAFLGTRTENHTDD